jgi:putative SbcD/Mre11-related phosphoesterase
MEIVKGIEIIDLCLYVKKEKILILADTHMGYEESLNKQGVLIPRFGFKETIKRLEGIFKKVGKVDKIIINGDIKHEFGTISEQEWRHALQLLNFLGRKCNEIILIKGNHDTTLGPIAEKRKVKIVDSYKIKDILVIHGHKVPELKGVKKIIIGHEHPAVNIREGVRVELFKCFLKGKFQRKTLIVQPSFNLVTEGTDVLKSKLLSPFLKHDLSNFECFVVGDKVYSFGKLKKLQ